MKIYIPFVGRCEINLTNLGLGYLFAFGSLMGNTKATAKMSDELRPTFDCEAALNRIYSSPTPTDTNTILAALGTTYQATALVLSKQYEPGRIINRANTVIKTGECPGNNGVFYKDDYREEAEDPHSPTSPYFIQSCSDYKAVRITSPDGSCFRDGPPSPCRPDAGFSVIPNEEVNMVDATYSLKLGL